MRESWRWIYRIILFQPRCCLLPAGWENTNTGGYFPWSTFNFRQDRNKHKRRHCIPPSCPDRGSKLGLLIPPEVEFCPWNKSCSQRKMNCPPWRLFHGGFWFSPYKFQEGTSPALWKHREWAGAFFSGRSVEYWYMPGVSAKVRLHLPGDVAESQPDLGRNPSFSPHSRWKLRLIPQLFWLNFLTCKFTIMELKVR